MRAVFVDTHLLTGLRYGGLPPALTGEKTAPLSASAGLLGLSMPSARAPIQSQCDQAPSWQPPPPERHGAERRPNDCHRKGARPRTPTTLAVLWILASRIFDERCWLACQVCRRRPPRGGNERDSCELSDENANTRAHQGCVCWLHVERSSSLGHACIVPRHRSVVSWQASSTTMHRLELAALQTGQAFGQPGTRVAQ